MGRAAELAAQGTGILGRALLLSLVQYIHMYSRGGGVSGGRGRGVRWREGWRFGKRGRGGRMEGWAGWGGVLRSGGGIVHLNGSRERDDDDDDDAPE